MMTGAGPLLPHTLKRLLPLASTLEVLSLSGNRALGGCTIPDDIISQLPHLKVLNLAKMDLQGTMPLVIGVLKAKGCKVDLSGNQGFQLPEDCKASDDTEFEGITKIDFSDCLLEGSVTSSWFAWLSELDEYHFGGNPLLNQSTVAGWVACNTTNLRDQAEVNLSDKNLSGTLLLSLLISPGHPKRIIRRLLSARGDSARSWFPQSEWM
jgi:hypothetical protein